MFKEPATINQGESVKRYRRYRKRRWQAQVRSNRRAEIWIVSIMALGVLAMGISWIVSLSLPGLPGASFVNQPAGESGGGGTPPVIIIQDNSAKPDPPGK
jgi:hypothetical protein